MNSIEYAYVKTMLKRTNLETLKNMLRQREGNRSQLTKLIKKEIENRKEIQ